MECLYKYYFKEETLKFFQFENEAVFPEIFKKSQN